MGAHITFSLQHKPTLELASRRAENGHVGPASSSPVKLLSRPCRFVNKKESWSCEQYILRALTLIQARVRDTFNTDEPNKHCASSSQEEVGHSTTIRDKHSSVPHANRGRSEINLEREPARINTATLARSRLVSKHNLLSPPAPLHHE
jgi:hypothetical protein